MLIYECIIVVLPQQSGPGDREGSPGAHEGLPSERRLQLPAELLEGDRAVHRGLKELPVTLYVFHVIAPLTNCFNYTQLTSFFFFFLTYVFVSWARWWPRSICQWQEVFDEAKREDDGSSSDSKCLSLLCNSCKIKRLNRCCSLFYFFPIKYSYHASLTRARNHLAIKFKGQPLPYTHTHNLNMSQPFISYSSTIQMYQTITLINNFFSKFDASKLS